MCGYVASRIAMRESIEIVCNECLQPIGNITDVVCYSHNGLTSVRVERVVCDCEVDKDKEIAQLKERLEQCSHSNSLAEKIRSAARITHVK